MDQGRFHSGRWMLLAEGLLVCALGAGGLIWAMLHPHAGPTGAPFLGLPSTWAHSVLLLVFGAVAVAAVGKRRAAVTVTALSAVAYTILLFFTSVATARSKPTPFGFHAADIVLHGVLAVVNLALLMWLIPDELGDEAWAPRRRQGRDRERRTTPSAPQRAPASEPASTHPPVSVPPSPHPRTAEDPGPEPSLPSVAGPNPLGRPRSRVHDAVLSHRALVAAVLVFLLVGVVIWMRRR